MNTTLFRKDRYKLLLLFLICISNPLYITNQSFFYNFYGLLIGFIVLGTLIQLDIKWFKNKKYTLIEWVYYRLSVSLIQIIVILYLALVLISLFAGTKYENSVTVVVIICWSLSLIVIAYICKDIIFIILKLKSISQNVINKWETIFLVFVNILLVYIALEISFAFGYDLFLSTFANKDLNTFQSFYLSFAISNTLPLEETYSSYIELIQKNPYINVFQIFHVMISKIMNLVVLGITLNYLYIVLEDKKR